MKVTRIGLLMLCLLVAGVFVGCVTSPSDAIKGAQGTLAIYDPNSSKPAVEYITGGASVAATKIRLSDTKKGGRLLTIGSVAEQDTVAQQQGQDAVVQQNAYAQGFRDTLQFAAAIMGKQFTPTETTKAGWTATTPEAVPALPGAKATTTGDVAAMLAACETPEEQQTVLKILGLLPKSAKAKAAKKEATSQPAK